MDSGFGSPLNPRSVSLFSRESGNANDSRAAAFVDAAEGEALSEREIAMLMESADANDASLPLPRGADTDDQSSVSLSLFG